MNILIGILLTIHVIVCLLLLLIVLMQRPRSEGLGTAFGGGVTDTLFGSGAGNVLTKITTWLGVIFFVTTITLAYLYGHFDHQEGGSIGLREKLKAGKSVKTAPAIPAAPVSPDAPSGEPLPVPAPAGKK